MSSTLDLVPTFHLIRPFVLIALIGAAPGSALAQGEPTQLANAITPDSALVIGRGLRAQGLPDSALFQFRYYAEAGQHKGLGYLEMARTLLTAGSTVGAEHYFAGASDDDSVSVAAYFDDLRWILQPGDSAAFWNLSGSYRTAWLRLFWGKRAAAGLTLTNARLVEHYRRLFYARRYYPLVPAPRRYNGWERVHTGVTEFDDRGLIYVRHGRPTQIVKSERSATAVASTTEHIDQKELADRQEYFSQLQQVVSQQNPDPPAVADSGGRRGPTARSPQATLGPVGGKPLADDNLSFAMEHHVTHRDSGVGALVQSAPPPTMTWVYSRPGENLVFDFVACARLNEAPAGRSSHWSSMLLKYGNCKEPRDYRLVESPLDAYHADPDAAAADKGFVFWERGDTTSSGDPVVLSLRDRETVSPLASRLLSASQTTAASVASQVRQEGERVVALGLETESYGPVYDADLDGVVELVAVGDQDGLPLIHATWSVNAAGLMYHSTEEGLRLPLRVRAIFTDSDGQPIGRLDSTLIYHTSERLPDNQVAVGRLAFPVPAGSYHYRIAIENPGPDGSVAGMIAPLAVLNAWPVDGRVFSVSDLVLGAHEVDLPWPATPADTAWFNPTASFSRQALVEVYYEMRGATPDAEYHVEYTVTRRQRQEAAIRVAFTDRPAAATARVSRTLDLSELDNGQYDLRVAVTTPEGQSITRTRTFEIRRAGR